MHGRHQATARVLPAHQGLYTGQAALTVHLRLVVQQQRRGLGFQRSAQVAAQRQAFAGGFLQGLGEKVHAAVARILGAVHGGFCFTQQFRRVAAVVGNHHHARPGRQVQHLALHFQRLGNHGQQAFDGACSLGRCLVQIALQVAQQQGKGVTVHPGQRLALALQRAQPPGHGAQHDISGGHAKRVVDRLERVDVDGGQGCAARLQIGRCQLLHDLFEQRAPVAQPGQRVEMGQLADFGLGREAGADVAHRHHAHLAVAQLAAAYAAFAGDGLPLCILQLHFPHAFHALRGALNGALQKGGGDPGEHGRAHQPSGRNAHEAVSGRVRIGDASVFVQDDGFKGGV